MAMRDGVRSKCDAGLVQFSDLGPGEAGASEKRQWRVADEECWQKYRGGESELMKNWKCDFGEIGETIVEGDNDRLGRSPERERGDGIRRG